MVLRTPGKRPTVAIIGAGVGGIAMGIQLKRAGHDDFVILERAAGVAGTWRANRYPGAGCDVPSHLYCFSFAPNPGWERKFALQPEIERYLQRCVDESGLAPHLRLNTDVTGAVFDEATGAWRISIAGQDPLAANVLVASTGQLSRPHTPALAGLASFAGPTLHTACWDPALELTGKRVVVIGNGASAIQLVPELARRAGHVTVLQRSPAYVLRRKDRRYRPWEQWAFRHLPGVRWLYRALIYWSLEARFGAFRPDSMIARLTRWIVLRQMHAVVTDPVLRAKLTPDYPIGCKRILISDDWYESLVKPNVALVTSAIDHVTADALVTADGVAHPADILVFATGFQTTEFLAPLEITGRHGRTLAETWRDGAVAHHGVTVSGFPNLFLLYGPNTNLGHSSILFMIECQVRYTLGCIAALARRGSPWLDVRPEAMARSNAELQRALADTAWAADCHSWYKTADGMITNNWSGRTTAYWWQTRTPELADYELAEP